MMKLNPAGAQKRPIEDEIARKNVRPRRVPDAADTAKMTSQDDKNMPKYGEFAGHAA
jgi:hypothetical protein